MKKYFILLLLLLAIPISVNASEKWLIDYVKDVDRYVYNYEEIEYSEAESLVMNNDVKEHVTSNEDKAYLVDSTSSSMKNQASDSIPDYYVFLIVVSLVAVVLSASKRFIDIGR